MSIYPLKGGIGLSGRTIALIGIGVGEIGISNVEICYVADIDHLLTLPSQEPGLLCQRSQ